MGWTYNTLNPHAETDAPTIAAVGVTFTTASFIIICLRMYVRGFMIKAVGVDDWVIVATWPCSLGFLLVSLLRKSNVNRLRDTIEADAGNRNEMGTWTSTSRRYAGQEHLQLRSGKILIYSSGIALILTISKLQYAGAPFYISSIWGFKLSLLFSFLRIAAEKKYKIAIIGLMVACTIFNLCFLIIQLNLCIPAAKQWDPSITTGHCLAAVPFYTSMASITIVFDVLIMLTPFPMLLNSRLPNRKKVAILGIFSLGTFVTAIQIIRILSIKSLANYIDSSKLIMWSMVENNLGIMAASIPPLAPLFRSFRDKSSKGNSRTTIPARASTYILQSMRPHKDGLLELGRGNDGSQSYSNTITGGTTQGTSDEFTRDSTILRTTEVTVEKHGV
ncbi:Satratoxin biosynthesis SC1 cluster protein [Lachnellula subtilissima]|uniref:Satratoxin biosynthesis SC1 cluster protein n=1 Tax=Lachnellula subtilissima TaxID=602034 RepID=A0A8H8RQL7_9HELO|nr:Satratoxin biosynthesis SC1 cluster protein [Lachnellula subtilissima]